MTVNLALTTTTEEGSVTTGQTALDPATGLTGEEEAAFWDHVFFHHGGVEGPDGTRPPRDPATRREALERWQDSVLRNALARVVEFTRENRAREARARVPDFSRRARPAAPASPPTPASSPRGGA